MTDFDSIVIGGSSVPSLIITVILMTAAAVIPFICWRRKHRQQTNISYLIAGAAGFLVSARVLELGVHYICIISDNPVSRFINGNTAAYVLYGTVMAGVFEECGRHIVLKYLMKKNRTCENAVLYGIGHGGMEILAVVLPAMVTYLAVALLFSSGSTDDALSALNITEETASAALPSVQAAADYGYTTMAMSVIERVLAMLVHIGLTVIVFYGICTADRVCLPLAVVLHMLVDTFAALYQKGAVPLWAVELWTAVWTAVIVSVAVKLYGKLKGQVPAGGDI